MWVLREWDLEGGGKGRDQKCGGRRDNGKEKAETSRRGRG